MSCRDVDAGVDVCVVCEAAGDAAEPGLAVARVFAYPSAGAATQAGVSGPDLLYPARGLVLGAPDQQAPPLRQDRLVKAAFGPDVLSRVFGRPLGGAGHVSDVQVLEPNHVEATCEVGRGLLTPVLALVRLPYPQSSDPLTLGLLRRRAFRCPGLTPLGLPQPGTLSHRQARAMQLLAGRQCRGDHHATVDADRLACTRRRESHGLHGERDMPPSRAVTCDPVRLALRDGPRPSEPHPAALGHPDLAPATVKTPYMHPECKVCDAEPLSHVAPAAARTAVSARVEVPHRLAEVSQRLLLDILRSRRKPRVLRTRLREHPRLSQVAWQRPHQATLLVDVLVPVAVSAPGSVPVRFQGAELVQVPCEVPNVPGMRAVLHQQISLLGRRVQPIPGHAATLAGTTDIPGGRERGFPNCPKAAVPSAHS
jgi:hypothetical protein